MWDFEHPPANTSLAERYQLHYTDPAQCAVELHEGRADLGLIPIASLTPSLAIVPGCVIASPNRVRSIQLIIKIPSRQKYAQLAPNQTQEALTSIRTIAADTASRSSLAYAQILFQKFIGTQPEFLPTPADPIAMLQQADAALLIGDPALLAIESRNRIESQPNIGPCLWLDLAHLWRTRTHLPWVAAVWAIRPEALAHSATTETQLIEDLQHSRNHGLANINQLVEEWTPRIALPPSIIRRYLTHNIHYTLNQDCIATIELFRRYAAEAGILPPLPALRFL
jgi:chorismate dehydratase